MVLQPESGSCSDGTRLVANELDIRIASARMWTFMDGLDGTEYIINVKCDRVIDVYGAHSCTEGT